MWRFIFMALKKVKSKVSVLFSKDEVLAMAQEYSDISAQIKTLEARKKALSDKIKQGAETYGIKDDKGSYYLEDEHFICGKVAKKSLKINQEKAVAVLEERGLSDVVDVVTVKTVNEDKLSNAVSAGRISLNDVEDFTDSSTSYSVSVKVKEEAPEVQQSNLQAAKKK